MTEKILSHFAYFRFTPAFWSLEQSARMGFFSKFEQALHASTACAYFYQVAPMRSDCDVLLWTAAPAEDAASTARFFESLAQIINARRQWIEPTEILWGYTKPSQYARGASDQEIAPLQPQRGSYLVVYPFVKTAEWYLLSRDTRQGMMNQHIRMGHQYPDIKQLLLYSFGLQDQEFVVVYEMEDITRFSDLVNELRSSEARRYTERDTPVYAAVHKTAEELTALFAGQAGGQA